MIRYRYTGEIRDLLIEGQVAHPFPSGEIIVFDISVVSQPLVADCYFVNCDSPTS